jgi:4-diphosphocytidyl-2-C-methyl-D-erythritol kinase
MHRNPAGPIRAYAKINLGLFILARRSDGYHDLATVFHRVDVYDDIELQPSAVIGLTASSPGVPSDHTNLCHRAAAMVQERLHIRDGVHIRLTKNIPVGAGLGGGSADAAAVLRALPVFWGKHADPALLSSIALQLGSDVPYFLEPGSAVAHGRGEMLDRFVLDVPFTILVCFPEIAVSTAWAYGQVRTNPLSPDLREAVTAGMADPRRLGAELRNDFEPVVFAAFPAVARIKDTLLAGGAAYASLSGSGSSVFALFRSPDDAAHMAVQLRSLGCRTWLTAPHFQAP